MSRGLDRKFSRAASRGLCSIHHEGILGRDRTSLESAPITITIAILTVVIGFASIRQL